MRLQYRTDRGQGGKETEGSQEKCDNDEQRVLAGEPHDEDRDRQEGRRDGSEQVGRFDGGGAKAVFEAEVEQRGEEVVRARRNLRWLLERGRGLAHGSARGGGGRQALRGGVGGRLLAPGVRGLRVPDVPGGL